MRTCCWSGARYPGRAGSTFSFARRKARSKRRGPQAVAAEGHGPRARRLDPLAALASWRHGARAGAARLQLRAAEENVARRAALRALRKTGGAKADHCGGLGARFAQDPQ